MADSECRPHLGQNRSTSSPPPRSSAITPMTPAAISHIPMAHGGGSQIPMNMRAITGDERHLILDPALEKIYRKYPGPTLQSHDSVTSMESSINHPIPMTQDSIARTPSSMTPGEHVTEDEQNIDKMYRKFPCPTCFKGFKSKQQLIQHNLVHSGTRKYHCSYCDKSFKQLCHLQQHHRIHTGEKPYKCTMGDCDRQFAQLSNLQHHLRNHDDQVKKAANRQHACVICHRSYTNESSLKSHTLKMHVHIKPVSPNDDSSNDSTEKSFKRKKLPGGMYSPPTMVPIHRVSNSEERKLVSDRMMQKDLAECGKTQDKLSRKPKDDGCPPVVIDLEASGSSGHSPYRSSSYRYTTSKDLPHLNNSNNPAVTLADSHISSSRHEQGAHTQSNIAHHHQQPSYTDVHEQMRTFPHVLGLAPQGVGFIGSPPAHHHPITEALATNAHSENFKLYYSQDHHAITSSSLSPLPPVGSITSTALQSSRPRLNVSNSVNENMSHPLSFTPLRP